jgi:selenocysteine lyase/cysteine desulfurase
MYDITQLRQTEFPHSAEQTYLNHAAISPLPRRSGERVKQAIDGLSRDPAAFWMNEGMPAAQQLSEGVAALINAASPAEIVMSTTTGSALSAIARSLPLQRGDNILFCDTEFPSNVYPWLALEQRGVEARCVPAVHGGLTIETVARYADGRTRLVAASAVQFLSGHRTDMAAIGAYCRERNILFSVDAIQAIGHMRIDVQAMGIDILASGGQKSIMALPGSGLLYIRDAVCEQLTPWPIASNGTVDFLHWLAYDQTPLPGAARFAAGTPNLPGVFALLSSVGLIRELGLEAIDAHTTHLARRAHVALRELGYEVITPYDAMGPIVSFATRRSVAETDALVARLAAARIAVAKHLDAPGNPYIRVSVHCYNTVEDIERLVAALREWGGH